MYSYFIGCQLPGCTSTKKWDLLGAMFRPSQTFKVLQEQGHHETLVSCGRREGRGKEGRFATGEGGTCSLEPGFLFWILSSSSRKKSEGKSGRILHVIWWHSSTLQMPIIR